MRKNGIVALIAFSLVGFGEIGSRVIYGDDDRLDVYEVQDQVWVDLAKSTVALVNKRNLRQSGEFLELQTKSFGESRNYCKDERFYSQPTGAFCSGFLVGPDLIATAGHCVGLGDCGNVSFVFDFMMEDEATAITRFTESQVYNCKKVIVSKAENFGADYALVQLDRAVEGRTPLRLRSSGNLPVGEELTMIGHPSGLPSKVAGGAAVRKWAANGTFFVANTDSYGGNSGSAVFNTRTLEVEGILVRGETDFRYDSVKKCTASVLCKDDGCRGEDVTAIRYIADLISDAE